jgi:7-cyano-7-deazaguanine synthase in queuosine biosynthesis
MTVSFQLRVTLDEPLKPGVVALDWADSQRGTIDVSGTLLASVQPATVALELLRFAAAIYCADKIVLRSATDDGWTRDLSLSIPVSHLGNWRSASSALTEAVSFLSGDRWILRTRKIRERVQSAATSVSCEAVCLFSGGLDSLAGAIDLLEEGRSLCLVGHHEAGLTSGRQRQLARDLATHYGSDKVTLLQLFLRPAPPRHLQEQPLPPAVEKTTRARSLLFVAAGLAVADAVGHDVPLYVPENGFIGINVPLTASRAGSLSTRTTHPFFLDRLLVGLDQLGITNNIENPFRLSTKGEVVAGSRNSKLLAALFSESLSCAHPEAARYFDRPQGNCGYCYPCLIRRASLHHAGLDSAAEYAYDVLTESEFIDDAASDRGLALWAVLRSLFRPGAWSDVLRNGPIPGADRAAFDGVYRRGRDELLRWLSTTSNSQLRARLPSKSR